MGGFDPDVISDWKDQTDGAEDGQAVGVVDAAPGRWRVDVYAHVGSMNGRAILDEAREKIGQAFRRSHGDRAFPLCWRKRSSSTAKTILGTKVSGRMCGPRSPAAV
jgi:hypothetical protein